MFATVVATAPPVAAEVVVRSIDVGVSTFAIASDDDDGRVFVLTNSPSVIVVFEDGVQTGYISVGGVAGKLAYDDDRNRLFLLQNTGRLVAVDTDTNSIITTRTLTGDPQDLDVDAVTGQVFVTQYNLGKLAILDGSDLSTVTTVDAGPYANEVAVGDGKVYVMNDGDGIAILQGPTYERIGLIPAFNVRQLEIPAGTQRLYISLGWHESNAQVRVVSTQTNAVLGSLEVSEEAQYFAFNGDASRLYVSTQGDYVSVIETATMTEVAVVGGVYARGVTFSEATGVASLVGLRYDANWNPRGVLEDIEYSPPLASPPVVSVAPAEFPEGDPIFQPDHPLGDYDYEVINTIEVTLDEPSSEWVKVTWSIGDPGTATGNEDYHEGTRWYTLIAPGETSVDVRVPTLSDFDVEPDETYTLSITGAVGATIGDGAATIGMLDDDAGRPPKPIVSLVDDVVVGEADGPGVMDIALDAPASEDIELYWYWTSEGTATNPDDFDPAWGAVLIPAGQTAASFEVDVVDDDEVENDETIEIILGELRGPVAATDRTIKKFTIVDDDRGDDDGVLDSTEDGAPNDGDGNDDGVLDSQQPNVTSLPSSVGPYVTLASEAGTSIVGVTAVEPSIDPPAGYTLPDGLFDFAIEGVTPGGSTTVRVFTQSAGGITGWLKLDGGVWTVLPASQVTIDSAGAWIDITLIDGASGDSDGAADGRVVDPGGIAVASDSAAPTVACGSAPAVWSGVDVSIACSASDTGSGLADEVDASFALSTSVAAGTQTTNAATNSRSICDVAGNCAAAGPITGIRVDKSLPTVTITSPTGANVTRNSTLTARYSCADLGSGLRSCVGTVANGARLPTSTTGTRSFTVTATDNVGNITTRTVTYQVVPPNAAPSVRADMGITGLNDVGFQSRAVTLSGTFSDVDGSGPYAATVQWAPGGAFVPVTVTGSGFVGSYTYPSSGSRLVTVRVCDAAGACGTDAVTVRASVSQRVRPVVQCVTDRGSRVTPRYAARLGYDNPASFAIVVPTTSSENAFTSSPINRGQPQIFRPGQQRNVFTVTFSSGTQSWRLNGTTASMNANTRRC